MSKKYLTYNQQMKHLRDAKHISCGGSPDKEILCRNGYFNLVNGYKTPFVQSIGTNGQKSYFPGTSIKELFYLKHFDEELRLLLLGRITKAEEEVRTFAAYKFDEVNNKGLTPWYDTNAYNSNRSITDVVKIISTGYSEISRSQLAYVKHYLDEHHSIPTWVYFKVIRFSTFITSLTLCKDDVCNSLCDLYGMKKANGQPNIKLLISSLQFLRTIRNACAHNERVYDINRPNGRIIEPVLLSMRPVYQRTRKQMILDSIIYLKYYLDPEEYEKMIDSFHALLTNLQNNISINAFDRVRARLGFKNLNDLLLLKQDRFMKNYNKF